MDFIWYVLLLAVIGGGFWWLWNAYRKKDGDK